MNINQHSTDISVTLIIATRSTLDQQATDVSINTGSTLDQGKQVRMRLSIKLIVSKQAHSIVFIVQQ